MFYVSYLLDEIQYLVDCVLVLEVGKVKVFGLLEEVWSSSVMYFWLLVEQQSIIFSVIVVVQYLQYVMMVLVLGDQLLWVNWFECFVGDIVWICIQVLDVLLILVQLFGISICNILCVEVVQYLEVNGQIEVQFRVSGCLLWVRISLWVWDDLVIVSGQQVFVQIKSVLIVV